MQKKKKKKVFRKKKKNDLLLFCNYLEVCTVLGLSVPLPEKLLVHLGQQPSDRGHDYKQKSNKKTLLDCEKKNCGEVQKNIKSIFFKN